MSDQKVIAWTTLRDGDRNAGEMGMVTQGYRVQVPSGEAAALLFSLQHIVDTAASAGVYEVDNLPVECNGYEVVGLEQFRDYIDKGESAKYSGNQEAVQRRIDARHRR